MSLTVEGTPTGTRHKPPAGSTAEVDPHGFCLSYLRYPTGQRTWREVADLMAERMYHHAFCETHPESAPDLVGCPRCRDRAALRAYEAKAGGPVTTSLDRLTDLVTYGVTGDGLVMRPDRDTSPREDLR